MKKFRRKVSFSLINPPEGVRIIRNITPDAPDPIGHMWVEHYTDLYLSGLFDLEDTCLDLNLPLP